MKLKKLFVLLLMINIFALIGVVLIFDEYQKTTAKLQYAYGLQHKSLILADELRQSSDDLTRMARTYVVTGNSMFEEQFHNVLDIRNGIINRPKSYNRIYWDFLTVGKSQPILDGNKKALRLMMKESGFPDSELELLFQSAEQSDKLTHLETKAMNAVKGIFQDKNGNYTIKGIPDLHLAASIMHGDEYHKAKINIMKPLDKFYQAFESRTRTLVHQADQNVQVVGRYLGGAIFLLMFLVIFSFFIILSRIIHPLEALKNSMLQLANNDMDTKLPSHQFMDEVGDMIGTVEIFKTNAIKLFQEEEKLKIAIKAAKEANHSKSIFLANMSHELRTPLNAILGFTSLLKKSQNVSKQEKANLTVIQSSGNHLLSIINEILELSKIEVGKIDIVNKDFDFFSMIDDIKLMFESRCKLKNITLKILIKEKISQFIIGDPQRLKQILINILGNSLKFTDSGFINCTISTKKNMLHFSIEDSGIGISHQNKEIIFKQFEQIKTKNNTNKGTGLGLSITKELVKLMGGKIRVQSQLGMGSTFSFTILYNPIEHNIIEENYHLEVNTLHFKKDTTILVADDIQENRNLLSQILKQYGLHIIEAVDGLDVLEKLENHNIDMIFLDILMPNLNGYETMTKMNKHSKYKDIPIVVVSANVFKEDKDKAISHGANDFLSKPINDDEVYKMLKKYLNIPDIIEERIIIDEDRKEELSKEFKEKINESIKKLDGNSILKLIEEYNISSTLKDTIEKKVKNFRFDDIIV